MTKSCTRTSSGESFSRHSRPAFLKSPTSSLFLVSTEIAGSLKVSVLDATADVAKLRVASGMVCALARRLAIGLHTVAEPAQEFADERAPDLVPMSRRLWLSLRRLLQVQRSGDIGSPRASGSTNLFKSSSNRGSRATSDLRPPPRRRIPPRDSETGAPR